VGTSPPPPWLSPTLARAVARADVNWPDMPAPTSHAAAHLVAEAWAPAAVAAREEQARFAWRHGLDDRSPWHHRRIVEFALGVPEAIRRLGGVPKGLVRHAMARRLPDRTLSGVSYGDHAYLVRDALARVGSRRLQTRLTIAARGWVQPAEVGALHDRLDAAVAAGDPRWPDLAHALWQVVAVELWHRARSGVDARSADS
ncbi:MAG: asparagine synthase-related protein, partial [Vicinamibacteria bacterium]